MKSHLIAMLLLIGILMTETWKVHVKFSYYLLKIKTSGKATLNPDYVSRK